MTSLLIYDHLYLPPSVSLHTIQCTNVHYPKIMNLQHYILKTYIKTKTEVNKVDPPWINWRVEK